MNCRECIENLDLYIDGVLSKAEGKAVESHIGECEACKAEYESLSAIIAGLQSLDEELLPSGFDEKLRASLEQINQPIASQRPKGKGKPYRWMAYVAASLLVMAGSYAIFENVEVPDKPDQQLSMKTEVESDSSAADMAQEYPGKDKSEQSIAAEDKDMQLADSSRKNTMKEIDGSDETAGGQGQNENASPVPAESEPAQQQTIAMSSLESDMTVESDSLDEPPVYEKFAAKPFTAPNVVNVDGESTNLEVITIGMGDMLKITLESGEWSYSVQGDVLEPVGAETAGELLEISFIPLKAGEGRIILAKKPSQTNQPADSKEVTIKVE
ncbi:hypothetical protein EAL2_c06760 [Peptoclostridium acidaminophilum DSM 3953]|uniref:Anti-sigma-W factor RsiW n=1 Tax=Peptoclostridium acidaminophilum DSM 3953 TaxID=1286171 RepID=W8TIE2_PEPAC|nr:zf-HC2 domain-containing protein [Peptoclostridium acidaminophilum]AHM55977.1 hypothetical protein EAL2_c06760 [Peptoclostridium acidaminophilum DSM 3953]